MVSPISARVCSTSARVAATSSPWRARSFVSSLAAVPIRSDDGSGEVGGVPVGVQEVVDQTQQLVGVALDHLQTGLRGVGQPVVHGQQLGVAADGRQRGAQLVGDAGHELGDDARAIEPAIAPDETVARRILGDHELQADASLALGPGAWTLFRFDERGAVTERRQAEGRGDGDDLVVRRILEVGEARFFIISGGELDGWAVREDEPSYRLRAVVGRLFSEKAKNMGYVSRVVGGQRAPGLRVDHADHLRAGHRPARPGGGRDAGLVRDLGPGDRRRLRGPAGGGTRSGSRRSCRRASCSGSAWARSSMGSCSR